jgi:hypothetical protein
MDVWEVPVSSCPGLDRGPLMDVGPFLKEFVKRKRFSPDRLRNGSAGRGSRPFRVCRSRSLPRSGRCHFSAASRLSSLREVAIVLFRRDCSQLIPSQGTIHGYREQLGPVTDPGRCGRIWCEFLTARATPYTATCWPASPIADESRRIQGPTRVGPHGRDLKLPTGNSDRTTGPKLLFSLITSLIYPVSRPLRGAYTAPAGRLQYLGPGRRVGPCCEAT